MKDDTTETNFQLPNVSSAVVEPDPLAAPGPELVHHSKHGGHSMVTAVDPDKNHSLAQAVSITTETSEEMPSIEVTLEAANAQDAQTRKRPLQLMDLPVDVLEEVVRQVGASNDLISLAVCNSWLHAIVMPHMYSRFDIVWPEPGEETESRPGVDALAYGLGTLVMSGTLYGPQHMVYRHCKKCGESPTNGADGTESQKQVQIVSNYAQFVRKFAIGNGPAGSVAAYNYSTESGKMLGTLVSLAIMRMTNLEIFFWDMPTGIVKEVWGALSRLGHVRGDKKRPCNLSSIWVRCHDSKKIRSPSQIPPLNSKLHLGTARPETLSASFGRIESPNFSILPPLRKIGVVEIDEVAYLQELAFLIHKSRSRLRELRIGAARSSRLVESDSDGPGYYNEPSTTCLGAGGVLGMLMSCIEDWPRFVTGTQKSLRRQEAMSDLSSTSLVGAVTTGGRPASSGQTSAIPVASVGDEPKTEGPTGGSEAATPTVVSELPATSVTSGVTDVPRKLQQSAGSPRNDWNDFDRPTTTDFNRDDMSGDRRLELHVLELENITIASFVLRYSLDWSMLTELTLLNCALDEVFWGDLKTDFAPIPRTNAKAGAKPTALTHDFPLKLRKVHVDGVSTALISTLKDCLAPNTLECLFLQDRKDYTPSSKVTVDSIYKGPLRRHRASLQKLSIDSQIKHHVVRNSYEKWLVTRDVLAFICSGKMPKLRELAISIAYDDWHYLLTHLPNLPQLRSIFIPFIHDYPSQSYINPREIALQVLDIVTLRPEIEICYIGIQNKCFEILEGKKAELEAEITGMGDSGPNYGMWGDPLGEDATDSEEDDDEFFHSPGNDGARDTRPTPSADNAHDSGSDSETGSESGEDGKSGLEKGPKLRLREILFYTEKVEIFKVERGTIFFTT